MANVTKPATGRRWYNGPCGNVGLSPTFKHTLASAASGDVITFGDKMESNLKLTGVDLISAALGASTTVTLKVGSTTLVNAQSTSSAVAQRYALDDIITAGGEAITLTVGGGTASGDVKFKFYYEPLGNL